VGGEKTPLDKLKKSGQHVNPFPLGFGLGWKKKKPRKEKKVRGFVLNSGRSPPQKKGPPKKFWEQGKGQWKTWGSNKKKAKVQKNTSPKTPIPTPTQKKATGPPPAKKLGVCTQGRRQFLITVQLMRTKNIGKVPPWSHRAKKEIPNFG